MLKELIQDEEEVGLGKFSKESCFSKGGFTCHKILNQFPFYCKYTIELAMKVTTRTPQDQTSFHEEAYVRITHKVYSSL